MAKLKKRLSLRIPDRAALAVALVLVMTAAGSTLQAPLDNDNGLNGAEGSAPSTAMPLKTEKLDPAPSTDAAPSTDDVVGSARPLTARFVLFRHG